MCGRLKKFFKKLMHTSVMLFSVGMGTCLWYETMSEIICEMLILKKLAIFFSKSFNRNWYYLSFCLCLNCVFCKIYLWKLLLAFEINLLKNLTYRRNCIKAIVADNLKFLWKLSIFYENFRFSHLKVAKCYFCHFKIDLLSEK